MKGVIKSPALEEFIDGEGKTQLREKLMHSGIVTWTSADATDAAPLIAQGMAVGTIGVSEDMAPTGKIWWFNGTAMIDTTQTVAGFFGVA